MEFFCKNTFFSDFNSIFARRMREHIERRTSVRVVLANLFVIAFCGAMFYYIYKLQDPIHNQRINVNVQSEAINLTNRFTQLVHKAQAEANLFAFTGNSKHLTQFGELSNEINQCADSLLLVMPNKDNERRVQEVEQLIMRKGQISYVISRQFYYYDPLSEIKARLKAYTPPTPPGFQSNDSLSGNTVISIDSTIKILTDIKILSEKASSEYKRRIKEYEKKTSELITDDNHLSEEIAELLLDLNKEILESTVHEIENSENIVSENLSTTTYIAGAVLILIIVFVILILSDVNKGFRARKTAEKARADAEEAKKKTEETMESRHKMLLTVSHDIKSPLASIIGNLELMDNTGNEKEVNSIQQSAEHILNLLNNLLEFSSLEQGKLQVEKTRFNVKSLCDETAAMFEPIALKKNLRFLFENGIPDNLHANSDPLKLKQIIINLISNAIKYTIEGQISFRANLENGQLVLHVEDSGIGIPSDKIDEIFKPFVRTDSGSKISEGSGYGLSVVKGLVDLLEGNIEVTSEVGKGSRFTVCIPMKTEVVDANSKSLEDQVEQTAVEPVAQRRILVIDDDDTLLTVVSNMIGKLGHQVQICRSKSDIDVALHDTESFDCVLTDHEMGAISGNTILNLFKKAKPSKPVFLMTARVDYDNETAIREGFDGFLQKPFKIKDLEDIFGHHATQKEISPSNSEAVFADFPELCELMGGEEEAIRNVLTVFAQTTTDHLVALNDCIENNDFVRAHELCHKMLPMFIQLQQSNAIPFLTKMNNARGIKRARKAYPEWKDDAIQFMDMADKLLEMLSEKYGIN